MIHRFVFHDDKIAPIDEVRLSPGQGGLLGGWGLFTTMRIREGIPFAFERHWRRLERDAQKTRCPFPYEQEIVRARLAEVLRANRVREGCARMYIVFNQIGFWRSEEPFPPTDLILFSSDLPAYRDTVRLSVREHARHAASPLAGTKVTSWINNMWNLYEAQQSGFDEVILLNERGEVSECTAANIFCVRDGRVVTPPLGSGCLEGVTRSVLLEIGAGAGVRVEERTLMPEDLKVAEEVFISSTNRDLLPVAEIDGNKIVRENGPITQKLEKAFANYVREYVEARLAATPRA
jgi:branched-chain amino acid aminotransferase